MKRRRHTPEQIIRKLREAERMAAEGKQIPEIAKALEISENTFHRWRNQYGGMKANDVKELKQLRHENATLKRIVADKELENVALREVARETSRPGPEAQGGLHAAGPPRPLRASGVRARQTAPIDPATRAQPRPR